MGYVVKGGAALCMSLKIKSGACQGYWTWLRNVHLFSVAVLIFVFG